MLSVHAPEATVVEAVQTEKFPEPLRRAFGTGELGEDEVCALDALTLPQYRAILEEHADADTVQPAGSSWEAAYGNPKERRNFQLTCSQVPCTLELLRSFLLGRLQILVRG